MDNLQIIVLALVQGLSEFLPISSSAHLILIPKFTNWSDQGLAFDVAVHLGTLTAIIYYYRLMIKRLLVDCYYYMLKQQTIGQLKLAWGVLLGTIPVALAGLLLKDFIQFNLRSVQVIAYSTLIFGLLLGVASWVNTRNRNSRSEISWMDVGFIGLMQTLALIPGTSRSGITITAGLLIGLSKHLSVQFSFLLAIPAIILSAMLMLLDLYNQPYSVDWLALALGFLVAALSAYITIVFFIKLLDSIGLMPFVVYRVLLGILLLIV